jgi:hypothetical protein
MQQVDAMILLDYGKIFPEHAIEAPTADLGTTAAL